MEIRELEAQPILANQGAGRLDQIGRLFVELMQPVREVVMANGLELKSPPMCRYLSRDSKEGIVEIQAGVYLAVPCPQYGSVVCRFLPAGLAVVADHIGPYRNLGETHGAIARFVGDQPDLKRAGPVWEVYWSDPDEVPAEKLRTEVYFPVIRT